MVKGIQRELDLIAASPLAMVSQDPLLNDLVRYLDVARARILREPHAEHALEFSRARLEQSRQAFAKMIRQGESKLHVLCDLLSRHFMAQGFTLQSVVIGEVATTFERFTLMQRLTADDLYATTDLDLGNRQLQRIQVHDGREWVRANLVANFVEYQPSSMGPFAIHRMISRIKAEEAIWNKVVDEIFGLDALVTQDKQLRALSRFVKDIFGVKFVVDSAEDMEALHAALVDLRWDEPHLERFGVPARPSTEKLELVEVKQYVGEDEKRSGWEAIKTVTSWWDRLFEIQILTLQTHQNERELLTKQSHAGFKARREQVRDVVAQQVPLFKFYRDLLQWLFMARPGQTPPVLEGLRVVVAD